jgi:ubiquinone/menaquinone biosynthesis C-methylase UbiE
VTAVDLVPENVELLGRLHGEQVRDGLIVPVVADATCLPLPSQSFELAFCLETLEHVRDDEAAVRELARLLAPGGTCVVSVPNVEAPAPLVERLGLDSVHAAEGPEEHVRPGYSRGELRKLLSTAGFEVIELTGIGGPPYRLAAGLVSLVHLAYRRSRQQRTWTWADVEADRQSPLLHLYAMVFPGFLRVARMGALDHRNPSTLLAVARRL